MPLNLPYFMLVSWVVICCLLKHWGMCQKKDSGWEIYIYNIKRSALGCLSGSVFWNANACMYNLWVERLSSLKRWPTHKYVVQVLSTDKFWLSLAMRATNTVSVTGLEGWVGGGQKWAEVVMIRASAVGRRALPSRRVRGRWESFRGKVAWQGWARLVGK